MRARRPELAAVDVPCRKDGGGVVSPRRLRELAATVAAATGCHLFVQEVEDGASAMDWHTVTVPRSLLARGEAPVLCTLLHEWGHRTTSPRSPEHFVALATGVSVRCGLGLDEALEVVNIASDLWVEDHWLADHRWGSLYAANLEQERREVECVIAAGTPTRVSSGLTEVARALCQVPVERSRRHGHALPELERCPLTERVLDYLFDDRRPESERLRLLADDLRTLLGPKWEVARLRRQLGLMLGTVFRGGFDPAGRLESTDLSRLARELKDLGLGWRAASPLLDRADPRVRRRLQARLRRLELYPGLQRRLDLVLAGRRDPEREGWWPWAPGDPPGRLDLRASLERGGAAVPGVTTLQPGRGRSLTETGRRGGHVCLVIDNSGSTAGEVNQCEVEAALGAVEAARLHGDEVSLVVFGSRVTAEARPSRDYESVADSIALLDGDAGGTQLVPALRRALDLMSGPAGGGSLLVFTDTAVADLEDAIPVLGALSRWAETTFFCFCSEGEVKPFLQAVGGLGGLRVLASPVGDGFRESSIAQVLGPRGWS